jgi:hypothetical protein
MIDEQITETKTLCQLVGIPESVTELKHRWLNITVPALQDEALLQCVPAAWIPKILDHFREHCLSQVEGATYEDFAENAKDLFHQLIRDMAWELAGTELTLDEQIQLNADLTAMGAI